MQACTDKPDAGWDDSGFKSFTDLQYVPKFGEQTDPSRVQNQPNPTSTSPRNNSARVSQQQIPQQSSGAQNQDADQGVQNAAPLADASQTPEVLQPPLASLVDLKNKP